MIITTANLVSMCSKMAALSSNQANLATSDFLNFANLIQQNLASEILAAREEFLLYQDSVTVTANTANIRIPYRALNGVVRHLWFQDTASPANIYRLWAREIENIEDYSPSTTGTPDGFYVLGNSIVLLPSPSISGTLQIAYPFRPNQLVDSSTCTTVSTVTNTTSTSLTVPNVPSNFVSGGTFDIIDNLSGNGVIYYDQVGFISGTLMTFSNLLPNIATGMWVAQANQSPVPMLPEEAHPLLLESTIMRIEIIRGNAQRIKNSAALIQDARRSFDLLLDNRIISKAHVVGGNNPFMPEGARPY
jgi:hypothetical protein